MKKIISFSFFSIIYLFSNPTLSQSDLVNRDITTINFLIDFTNSNFSKEELFVQLKNLPVTKDVKTNTDNSFLLIYNNEALLSPNNAQNDLQNHLNQFGVIGKFNEHKEVLELYKPERISFKKILLAGINTSQEANQLKDLFLEKPQIVFADFNLISHELFIIFNNELPDELVNNVIQSTGKNVINSINEISKYY